MSASPTVRVGCLGAGYFSMFHHEAWCRLDGVHLAVIADSEPHKLDVALSQIAGIQNPKPAVSLDELLTSTTIDILDIIIPPDGHAEAIRYACDAGVKTIICQKPFCRDLAEAKEITDYAEQAGAVLIVHENFRFQPWYRVFKQYVENEQIGMPLQMNFRLRPGDGQGTNPYAARQPYFQQMERFLVHETAIHFLDVFSYLFGPVHSVYADLKQRNPHIAGEDSGFIILEHLNGTTSCFDGNRLLDHHADNLRLTLGEALVEGTKASLSLNGNGEVYLRHFAQNSVHCVLERYNWKGFGGDCVYALQKHVCRYLREGHRLENTAREYLDRLHLEEVVYRSAETGKKIIIAEK